MKCHSLFRGRLLEFHVKGANLGQARFLARAHKYSPAVVPLDETYSQSRSAVRKVIIGNNLDYYINLLKETRERTLAEFRKRDDKWLMTVDKDWPWGPTNNYCKWFHVTEHEANHNGQIKLIKGRLPGAKVASE